MILKTIKYLLLNTFLIAYLLYELFIILFKTVIVKVNILFVLIIIIILKNLIYVVCPFNIFTFIIKSLNNTDLIFNLYFHLNYPLIFFLNNLCKYHHSIICQLYHF